VGDTVIIFDGLDVGMVARSGAVTDDQSDSLSDEARFRSWDVFYPVICDAYSMQTTKASTS
jgi:hypothetical protein